MLRRLIKSLIPSQDKIFFDLIIKEIEVVENSANILDKLTKEEDNLTISILYEELMSTRTVTTELIKKIDYELDRYFITPVDRVELHNITTLLLKANRRIVKIYRYMQILMEEERRNINIYLTNSVETLRKITKFLKDMMKSFVNSNYKDLKIFYIKLTKLDENILEELGNALRNTSHYEAGDLIFIIKIKDIYKAIESAIYTCTSVAESIMRLYVKEV